MTDLKLVSARRFAGRVSIAIAGLLPGIACSFTLDFDEKRPCNDASECMYSNGPGVCLDGYCSPAGGGSETGPGTETDDATDGASSGTDDGTADDTTTGTPVACEANSECAMDQRCHSDGNCRNLISAECQLVRWPENGERDNVLFVGSIIPTSGTFANSLTPLRNAVQLAFDDFNEATTLPSGASLAWVGCDSSDGSDAAVAAAAHLVDSVEVPAIIGPVFSEDVIAVASDVTVAAGVYVISPTATAEQVTEISDDGLVWRTIASDVYQANAIIDRYAELVDDIDRPLENLLVLAKDDLYGGDLLSAVATEFQTLVPGTYTPLKYDNPSNFDNDEDRLAAYGATLAGALGETNDYSDVLIIGTSEAQILINSYVNIWDTTIQNQGSPPMPRFTVSHGAVPDLEALVEDFGLPGTPTEGQAEWKLELLNSLEGISPIVADPSNFNAFNLRYRIEFNGQDALPGSGLAYDAALVAFFAMSAIDAEAAITGTAMAEAMPRLQSGDVHNFGGAGTSFITDIRNQLVTGGSVDLQGVSGALQWNEFGDVRTDLLQWELENTGSEEDPSPNLNEVQLYCLNPAPATDGTWTGNLTPCE